MKLIAPKNVNYCGTVAKVDNINTLENCDNVVAAVVCGSQVIVGKETKVGDIGIFFPVECRISSNFLAHNNLFRKKELNKDPEKAGYFEEKGRLRAVKFRGHKSEGIFLPLSSLSYALGEDTLEIGDDFDCIGEEQICEKYVVQHSRTPGEGGKGSKNQPKRKSRKVDGQFKLHTDTAKLQRNIHRVSPEGLISISNKLHGTSAVFGNLLVKREFTRVEKVLNYFGVNVESTEYDLLFSSRKVIKNGFFDDIKREASGDIWAEWAKKLKPFIPKGTTLYGEIVGFKSNGGQIQKGYHYGCAAATSKFYCYRITQTDEDGNVFEYTRPVIDEFCKRYGIGVTPLFYYGKAKDVYPEIPIDENWGKNFRERLSGDENFSMGDIKCSMCADEVPAEGCVLRLESMYDAAPFKLKNYAFLERETKALDKGEADIEEEN